MKLSANLGFLWADLPLPEAIRRAKAAGFDAVECHWPYDTDPGAVRAALEETGLPMLGLNTVRGDVPAGEMGLSALPGRSDDARAAVDQAVGYGAEIGARNVHVMAGVSEGEAAREAFVTCLGYACRVAGEAGLGVLIEPLNRHDAPGYFLRTTDQAAEIIGAVGAPNLKIMFDCYHVQRTEGDVTTRLTALLPLIGHIQIASSPDRGAPDHGELNYAHVFAHLENLGWQVPIGAEYRPAGPVEDGLSWMPASRV